ncbi:hypothetical protein [Neorhizobium petrolearium]|uniref:hypothetical protein n=1 Tax=Neorhizobium petrolearium TaxID=515361 RepID=UPI003F8068D7
MRHPGLICLLGLTTLLFGACYSGAQALDMYRNSTRYEIDVKTPDGLKFHEAGVDRVFSAHGIDVNLRLIQDRYDTCADLIEKRQSNRRKDGYTVASDRSLSQVACSVTLKNPFDGQMMTSHYLWIDVCSCFAALHFRYAESSSATMAKLAAPIIASLKKRGHRSSDAPAPEAATNGQGTGGVKCVPSRFQQGLCTLMDKRTNRPFIGQTTSTVDLTNNELKQLPKFYAALERADAVLRKRGMSSTNRRHLVEALSHGHEGNAGYGAFQLYLSNVFNTAYDPRASVSEKAWRSPATILSQFAFYFPHYYDPISGREVDRSSVESRARDLPKCFLKGDPERDCRPLRYHWWVGCWIRPEDRAKVVRDLSLWRIDGLGDIPMIPVAVAYEPFDLSKASRADQQKPKKPTGKKKVASNDNPAGRMACSSIDVWEGGEEEN